ncbi:hypothetical protein [Ruminococcus flavefaciens]|uniref:hypothetical protein n=1 Tax=Ruminococcus flavefaciens TaxID=1265 RepID=UPI0034E97FD5
MADLVSCFIGQRSEADTGQCSADAFLIRFLRFKLGETLIFDQKVIFSLPIIGTGFSNANGSCAGISIAQNMIISGKMNYSDILPEGYSCFMDLPSIVKGVEGFEDFVAKIDDLHTNWRYFSYRSHKVELTSDNIEGYAKLTKYGIALPGSMRIDNHSHAVTFLGVEKLDETKVIDSYTESGMSVFFAIEISSL